MRRKVLIGLGYLGFFVFGFIVSFYLTFDVGIIKSGLENLTKGGNFQLSINRLDKYRLSGFKAVGVKIRFTDSPTTIDIDQIQARISLIPLIFGKKKLSFKALLYGGKVSGMVLRGKKEFRAELTAQGLDLARLKAQPDKGLTISGKLMSKMEINLASLDNVKTWSGRIETSIGSGKISNLTYLGTSLPEINFDQGKFNLEMKSGRAEIKTLELSSPDFPLMGQGLIEFRLPIENSLFNLELKLSPSDSYLEQSELLKTLLPSDGRIPYQGNLAGLLSIF